jgi:hypothetical protein
VVLRLRLSSRRRIAVMCASCGSAGSAALIVVE